MIGAGIYNGVLLSRGGQERVQLTAPVASCDGGSLELDQLAGDR